MEEHAYPHLEPHRNEHNRFIEKVRAFQQSFEQKKTRLSVEIAAFLMEWWKAHILRHDKQCGAFLIPAGGRDCPAPDPATRN